MMSIKVSDGCVFCFSFNLHDDQTDVKSTQKTNVLQNEGFTPAFVPHLLSSSDMQTEHYIQYLT